MDNKDIYININKRGDRDDLHLLTSLRENITSTNLSDSKNSIEQEGGAAILNALVYTNEPIIKYLLLNTDLNNSNVQFLVPKLNQLYKKTKEQIDENAFSYIYETYLKTDNFKLLNSVLKKFNLDNNKGYIDDITNITSYITLSDYNIKSINKYFWKDLYNIGKLYEKYIEDVQKDIDNIKKIFNISNITAIEKGDYTFINFLNYFNINQDDNFIKNKYFEKLVLINQYKDIKEVNEINKNILNKIIEFYSLFKFFNLSKKYKQIENKYEENLNIYKLINEFQSTFNNYFSDEVANGDTIYEFMLTKIEKYIKEFFNIDIERKKSNNSDRDNGEYMYNKENTKKLYEYFPQINNELINNEKKNTNNFFCLYTYAHSYIDTNSDMLMGTFLKNHLKLFDIVSIYATTLDRIIFLQDLTKLSDEYRKDQDNYKYIDNIKSYILKIDGLKYFNTIVVDEIGYSLDKLIILNNKIESSDYNKIITNYYCDKLQLIEKIKIYYEVFGVDFTSKAIDLTNLEYKYFPDIEDRKFHFFKFLKDIEKTTLEKIKNDLEIFEKYVNIIRKDIIKDSKQLLFKYYLQENNEKDNEKIKEYIDYNQAINTITITIYTYESIKSIFTSTQIINIDTTNKNKDEEYIKDKIGSELFIEILKQTDIKLYLETLLKTNKQSYSKISNFLNQCAISNIKDKKLSGKKFIIKIINCLNIEDNKDDHFKIYNYLINNLDDKNSTSIIKKNIMNDILNNLTGINNTIKKSDIITLIKIYERKLIKDYNIDVFFNLIKAKLEQNVQIDSIISREEQKYLYNLLYTISPDSSLLNFGMLFKNYIMNIVIIKGKESLKQVPGAILGLGAIGLEKVKEKIGAKDVSSLLDIYANKELLVNINSSESANDLFNSNKFIEYIASEINNSTIFKSTIKKIHLFESKNPLYQFILDTPELLLNTIIIYLYFNFDSIIINLQTVIKIVYSLNYNNTKYNTVLKIDEKYKIIDINLLKIIITKHKDQLKQINKEMSIKLSYFIDNKLNYIQSNKVYKEQLYDILCEVSKQNIITLNLFNYLNEQKIVNVIIEEEAEIPKIINIINFFSLTEFNSLKDMLIKIKEGKCCKEDFEKIITSIDSTHIGTLTTYKMFKIKYDKYIKDNEKNSLNNINEIDCTFWIDYQIQYELYNYLLELTNKSTLISDVINKVVEKGTHTIKKVIKDKIHATLVDYGYDKTPEEYFEMASSVAEAAKTVAKIGGTALATFVAYKSIDYFFGKPTSTNNTPEYALEKNTFNESLKTFIGTVGIGLTLTTAQPLINKILPFVIDYIGLGYKNFNLPMPSIETSLISGVIVAGIQYYFSNNDDKQSESQPLISLLLKWIFDKIDHMFGFNNKLPEQEKPKVEIKSEQKVEVIPQTKSFENVYSHLQQNFYYDPYNIFKGIEINEHPNQIKIIERLKRKYNDFMKVTTNDSINLSKKDRTKIKKMIAEIINLEINMFKGSNKYTFVHAIKQFFNE